MVKFITLGIYDNKYKYMIFYILTRLPLEYFLGDIFPDEVKIKYLRSENFPNEILVYEVFKYFGMFIFGLIVLKLEIESLFTGNKTDKNKIGKKGEIKLIYHNNESPSLSKIKVLLLLFLYIINIKMMSFFYNILGHFGLDFWMLEIILIAVINIILFKIKIYFHQKIAIGIILIFSTLMKVIAIILIYMSEDQKIYMEYSWLCPIGIIGFILLYFVDGFVLCRMKWCFDLKFISEKKMLIRFGFLGFILFFIASLISNFIKCEEEIEFIFDFCKVYDEESSSDYFDNFLVFFKNIWLKDRTPFVNCIYIFIILLKILLSAFKYFFSFLIIKILSPEFLVCSDSILYFIIKIICLIYYVSTNSLKNDFIFDVLSQFFSLLGTIIYLELIELNFCGLNHDLKKNINFRANHEFLEIYNSESDIQTIDENVSEINLALDNII